MKMIKKIFRDLYELPIELWDIGGASKIAAVFLVGLYLILVLTFVVLIDGVLGSTDTRPTKLVGYSHTPAYCSTTMIMSGQVMIPSTTCYEEAWYAATKDGKCRIPSTEWQNHPVGSTIVVYGTSGLLSDSFYCTGVKAWNYD